MSFIKFLTALTLLAPLLSHALTVQELARRLNLNGVGPQHKRVFFHQHVFYLSLPPIKKAKN